MKPCGPSFKVVRVDNYDRETVANVAVAEWLDELDAEIICERLRKDLMRDDAVWYRVYPQEQKLWRGLAELV